ncbi:MAG: S41 family peptidase [Bacteroidota bacterium]
MRLTAVLLILLMLPASGQTSADRAEAYAEDFDAFWTFVDEYYAYFHVKQTDWDQVRAVYRPHAIQAADNRAFLNILEAAVGELYDPHAGFNTNNQASPRLIPSGTDLWAEWQNGQAVITSVRRGSNAEKAGIRPGMTVIDVAGVSVEQAVAAWMPKALGEPDPDARNWALRSALAGRHQDSVRVRLQHASNAEAFTFVPGLSRPAQRLSFETLPGNIGYIRVHNTLGDGRLVAAFDSALAELSSTKGLILDLRDTPGGGNTTVARGLMSRLIVEEQPYQKHELVSEERETGIRRFWTEWVAPRGPFSYSNPLIVLAGRWTGSMGEGLTIGLDGMGRATVVGTPMARLLGAVYTHRLPNTGIGIRVPAEQLRHVDGTPREAFVPPVLVDQQAGGRDEALLKALSLFE